MTIDDVLDRFERIGEDVFSGKAVNLEIGEHQTRNVGIGYEIKDVEQWRRGDPFGSINWRLSLATWPKKIYKTTKIETKEVPTIMLVDFSPSMTLRFGEESVKLQLMMDLIGLFSSTASYFRDPFGIIGVAEGLEFFIKPKFGRSHVLDAVEIILEKVDEYRDKIKSCKLPISNPTDLNEGLEVVVERSRRQSVVVVVSDFVDLIYGQKILDADILSALTARHQGNVLFLMLEDENEFLWQGGSGTIMTKDIETGRLGEVKTNKASAIRADLKVRQEIFCKKLEEVGIDSLIISSDNYLDKLADFVANRKIAFN